MTPILATGGGKPVPICMTIFTASLLRARQRMLVRASTRSNLPCARALKGRKDRRVAKIFKIARHRRRPQIRLSASKYCEKVRPRMGTKLGRAPFHNSGLYNGHAA